MYVIGPYFVWVAVSEALFWVSVDYFEWVWVGKGVWGIIFMGIILGGWDWVGVGTLFDNTPFNCIIVQNFLFFCHVGKIFMDVKKF